MGSTSLTKPLCDRETTIRRDDERSRMAEKKDKREASPSSAMFAHGGVSGDASGVGNNFKKDKATVSGALRIGDDVKNGSGYTPVLRDAEPPLGAVWE